jgi:hypothetical protein
VISETLRIAGYLVPLEAKLTREGVEAMLLFFSGHRAAADYDSAWPDYDRAWPDYDRAWPRLATWAGPTWLRKRAHDVILNIDMPTVVVAACDDKDPTTECLIVDMGSYVVQSRSDDDDENDNDNDSDTMTAGSTSAATSGNPTAAATAAAASGTTKQRCLHWWGRPGPSIVAVEGTGVQVLVACRSDDWRGLKEFKGLSDHHVLRSTRLAFSAHVSFASVVAKCSLEQVHLLVSPTNVRSVGEIGAAWSSVWRLQSGKAPAPERPQRGASTHGDRACAGAVQREFTFTFLCDELLVNVGGDTKRKGEVARRSG